MTDGVCHSEEAAPTKQSGSARLPGFARNDTYLSVRVPHHLTARAGRIRNIERENTRNGICFVAGAVLSMTVGANRGIRNPVRHGDTMDTLVVDFQNSGMAFPAGFGDISFISKSLAV